jgi:hypothetical protein
MANISSTTVDLSSVVLEAREFINDTLSFPQADDYLEGTIVSRLDDALAVTASAVSGGGNGTVSAATVVEGPVVPLVGVYTLTNVLAVTNGGKWKLVDPNGAIVADDLEQTVGAGAATVFEVGGLQFTITDGGTDFSLGATATLTVAASGKLVVYAPGGAGGTQNPIGILTYTASRASAGDLAVRVLVTGVVDQDRLIIDADGNANNITAAIRDRLRRIGIIPQKVQELSTLDN